MSTVDDLMSIVGKHLDTTSQGESEVVAAPEAALRAEYGRGLGEREQELPSLRDYFAARAMQGMLACPVQPESAGADVFARDAYMLADAMLKARES